MVYLDLSSLSLIDAMLRVGRGAADTWSHTAIDLSSLNLIGAMRAGGTRSEGGGEGAQIGRGEGAGGGGGGAHCTYSFIILV
jgi:hypothetical protein